MTNILVSIPTIIFSIQSATYFALLSTHSAPALSAKPFASISVKLLPNVQQTSPLPFHTHTHTQVHTPTEVVVKVSQILRFELA